MRFNMKKEQENLAILILNENIKSIIKMTEKTSQTINEFKILLDNLKIVKILIQDNAEFLQTINYLEKNALELGELFKEADSLIKEYRIQDVVISNTIKF